MTHSSTHDSTTSTLLCFFTGIAIAVMGYSLYSHLDHLQQQQEQQSRKRSGRLENAIPLRALAYLIQSSNATIQSSSVKITIERAMSGSNLPNIIAACEKDKPLDIRSQALTALQLLTQKEQHRATLLEAGALKVLVDALASTETEMKEMTQRYVAMAICDLIQGSDINKYCVIEMGILDSIQRILTSTTIRNNELKYWTLMILHQISLSDPFPNVLIHQGFVGLLAKMARMTFGNTNMPKFCMQSLVRLVASVDTMESKIVLVELLDYNIVDLISVCLRGDDVELIYWAAGLMHEFVLKDVASNQFRSIKGIHTILAGLLSAEEMYISRVVLRTIKFMAYGDESFRQGMVKTNIVKKIMHCLTLDDDDVRYWAVLCIHAVAGQVESHNDILTAPEFDILLELALSQKVHAAIFVADILSLICCIWQNDLAIEKHINLMVSTLNSLVTWNEVEVQYNSTGALFNLMAMQDSFATVIRQKCQETILSACYLSPHERVQLTCAKTSLMLAIKFPSMRPILYSTVMDPLIDNCITANEQLLPIMMMQVLVSCSQSSLEDPSTIINKPSISEDDLLRVPNYINVSSNGVISSDHQRDRRVQGSINDSDDLITKRGGRKRKNQLVSTVTPTDSSSFDTGSDSSSRSSLSSIDIDPAELLNDLSLLNNYSYSERVAILSRFEMTTMRHSKLTGALSALRYFLENESISKNILHGNFPTTILKLYEHTPKNQHKPLVTVSHRSSTSYHHQQQREQKHSTLFSSLDDYYNDIDEDYNSSVSDHDALFDDDEKDEGLANNITETSGLPGGIYGFVDGLVYQALFPVIGHWWQSCHSPQKAESMTMDESSTWQAYKDVLLWMHRTTTLATQQQRQKDDLIHPTSSGKCNVGKSSTLPTIIDSTTTHYESSIPSIKVYHGLTSRSLLVLRSLLRYESIRSYLIHNMQFIEMMTYMFQYNTTLTDHILTCLGILIQSDTYIPESSLQRCVVAIWRHMLDPTKIQRNKKTFWFYTRLVMTCASRRMGDELMTTASKTIENQRCVELDITRSTPFCLINQETCLEVRNDSWTFETVVGTHSVQVLSTMASSRKFCYQVVLKTDGLIQMGWSNRSSRVNAEAGSGVGDDGHSYGYDGCRCKKWHGRHRMRKTNYGKQWKLGDVVTCTLDLDRREIKYYQNGDDLGVAFTKVDTTKVWYPAVSLSTGQECEFLFGGPMNQLRHPPEGFQSIFDLHFTQTSNHLSSTTATDMITTTNMKVDLQDIKPVEDITEAMERMRVSSPPSLTPSPSLSLLAEMTTISKDTVTNSSQQQENKDRPTRHLYVETTIAHQSYVETTMMTTTTMGHTNIGSSNVTKLIMIGWTNCLPMHSNVALVYNHNRKQGMICLDTKELLPTPFSMDLQDDDIIGLEYDQQQYFGFTLNGKLLARVRLDIPFLPYLPYTMGPIKTRTNYGQDCFKYGDHQDELLKENMVTYLDQLMNGSSL